MSDTREHNAMVNRILLALSDAGCLAFTNPTGSAWVGQVIHSDKGLVTLRNARKIQYGLCIGSADIICGAPITITADMVGKTILQFAAHEVKTGKAVPTKEQKIFRDNILAAGGIAGIVRSPAEALALINRESKNEIRETHTQDNGSDPQCGANERKRDQGKGGA